MAEPILRQDLTRPMTSAEESHFGTDPVSEPELLHTIAELTGALSSLLALTHFENGADAPFTPEEARALWRGRRALAMRAPALLPNGSDPDQAATYRRLDAWVRAQVHNTDSATGAQFVG